VRLTHDGVPAESPETRRSCPLSPPAPCKAINALGCRPKAGKRVHHRDTEVTEKRTPCNGVEGPSLRFDPRSSAFICGSLGVIRGPWPVLGVSARGKKDGGRSPPYRCHRSVARDLWPVARRGGHSLQPAASGLPPPLSEPSFSAASLPPW
jgi:hypothetical protein